MTADRWLEGMELIRSLKSRGARRITIATRQTAALKVDDVENHLPLMNLLALAGAGSFKASKIDSTPLSFTPENLSSSIEASKQAFAMKHRSDDLAEHIALPLRLPLLDPPRPLPKEAQIYLFVPGTKMTPADLLRSMNLIKELKALGNRVTLIAPRLWFGSSEAMEGAFSVPSRCS